MTKIEKQMAVKVKDRKNQIRSNMPEEIHASLPFRALLEWFVKIFSTENSLKVN